MKKALIIANMLLASASVFGMNIKLDREPAERSFLHAVRKHDSSALEKRSSRHLGILNKRYLKLSMQNNFLKQENSILNQLLIQKDMDVDQMRPSDIEKLEQKVILLSDRVQDEKQMKISNQKQADDLKAKLENAKLDLNVTKLNLDAKRQELADVKRERDAAKRELADVKQERDAAKRELAETKRKFEEAMLKLKKAAFSQNNGGASKNFNIFF